MASLRLSDLISPGYYPIWKDRHLFRLIKGSKGSGKSKFAALWHIYMLMKYPQSNVLVIRKVMNTHRDSTYTDLLWAIDKLQVTKFWTYTVNPMELTYNPTGQKILFRGLDDPLKLASITVRYGFLNWVWFEEAFEITDYDAVLKVVMSIRGDLPEESGLWKQFTFTFNPWSEHHWLKEEFFDKVDNGVRSDAFCTTTTFRDNPFLGDDDVQRYLDLYTISPKAARVICDGDWGLAEGLIYDNWEVKEFDQYVVMREHPLAVPTFGLDFGFAVSMNAFVAVVVDVGSRTLWIYDEFYENHMSDLEIAKKLAEMGYAKERIYADSADPKSIYNLKRGVPEEIIIESLDEDAPKSTIQTWALPNIRPALKGPDSVEFGIRELQAYKMYVHPRCKNMIMELSNYQWDKDKNGDFLDKPLKEWDHLCDSLRYACTRFFVCGKGKVGNAKGIDGHVPKTVDPDRKRPRRVGATI